MNLGGDYRARFLPGREGVCPLAEFLGAMGGTDSVSVMDPLGLNFGEDPDVEGDEEEGCSPVESFFEEEVGPLGHDQARRLRLLVMSYGEAAVLRALAEVVILEMNNVVLRLVRDRLLARYRPL